MPGLVDSSDPLLKLLQQIIRLAVRVLAVLMTIMILLGVTDVAWMIIKKTMASSPRFVLSMNDILATFGAFLAVLIAIEIFVNIIMYLREDVIQVKIVVATALMAIARKVIILDFNETGSDFIWATAGVILATSVAYWLIDKADKVPRELRSQTELATQVNPLVHVESPTGTPPSKSGGTEIG